MDGDDDDGKEPAVPREIAWFYVYVKVNVFLPQKR